MSKRKNNTKIITSLVVFIMMIVAAFVTEDFYLNDEIENTSINVSVNQSQEYESISKIPEYTSELYVTVNDNEPYFTEEEYTTESFEEYSELDSLGRCGVAYANISKETMPPEGDERGSISSVRPSGWKQAKYDGEYVYNRCHLIAYSLSDEDANELNLITGTRYFNVEGMLTFEREILEYMQENEDNHVLYRVTPIFKGDNLVASGVEMEAYSVEDNGEGICFNVYIYNVQPGVTINYETGEISE